MTGEMGSANHGRGAIKYVGLASKAPDPKPDWNLKKLVMETDLL